METGTLLALYDQLYVPTEVKVPSGRVEWVTLPSVQFVFDAPVLDNAEIVKSAVSPEPALEAFLNVKSSVASSLVFKLLITEERSNLINPIRSVEAFLT